jgi:uncharacterized membrane protein
MKMPQMYIVSILIAILASMSYHVFQKFIPSNINPVLALLTIYLVGIVASAALFFFFPMQASISESVKQLNWASFAVGLTVVGIEIGFLLMYRAGWNISVGALVVNIGATLMLIPIGLLFFKEQLTPLNVLGVVVCMIGLVMINVKP